MKKHFRIAICGIGALGAAFARDIISHKSDIDLFGIVRDVNIYWGSPVIVNGKPLKINYRTVESLKNIPFDLVLLCVKSYELRDAIEQIRSLIGGDTLVGCVSSGIEAEEYLYAIFGKERVFIAVPEFFDVSRILFHVTVGRKGDLVIGSTDDSVAKKKRLEEIFSECHIPHIIVSDIRYHQWKQFMFDLSVGQTTLVYQLTYGEYIRNERATETAFNAMEEILNLAKVMKVGLSFSDIVHCIDIVKTLSNKGRSCLLQDYWVDRRLETEVLCDKAVSLASTLNIAFATNLWLRDQIQMMVVKDNLKAAEGTSTSRLSSRVNFVPTSDTIAEHLRVDILKGKFAKGTILKETELANRFNASRSSVRTALQAVVDEGLLITLPNGRREVVEISEKQLINLFSLRLLLENSAIEIIIDDASIDLSDVKAVLDEIELKQKHHKGEKDWSELDIKFHGKIVDAADNVFLSNSFRRYTKLWYTSTNFSHPLRQDIDYAAQFASSHAQLLGLLERRSREVFANLKAHIENTRDEMLLISGFKSR